MFRALLFVFGAVVTLCVLAYFTSGQARYLRWAGRLFLLGLGIGVAFFSILLVKRLI